MNKENFPAVVAKSPSDALVMLGIDEGAVLEYNPASGMYVVSKEEEDVGPGEGEYSYFAEAVGFSKKVIDALIEANIVEELLIPEDEKTEDKSEVDAEHYDKADLTMACGRCGAEEKIVEAIGGVSLFMPTTSEAKTMLVCRECGNRMSFIYKNGAMMTDEEKAELKAKQEEEQKKQQEAAAKDPLPVDYENKNYDSNDDKDLKETSDEPQKESE